MKNSSSSSPATAGGIHTVRNPGGRGWLNKVRGDRTAGSVYRVKKDAVIAGRALAIEFHTEHLVHKSNGRVASRISFGSDSYPPAE
jgi:hypothetical protein